MTVKLPPFQVLLDEHRVEIYRFLVATAGPVDADDAFQETWISALRAYPRLRRADNLRAWLFRIARNKATDTHRARARRAVPVGDVPEQPSPSLPDGDEELWARLRALPDKQRTAVFCRSVLGMPYPELAALLESSEDAARRNVHEGLKRLREELTMSDIETALRRAASGLPADAPDLSARAEEEGLVDVAYASVDSPLGPLLVASTPKGLVRLAYSEFRSPTTCSRSGRAHLAPRARGARATRPACGGSSTSTSQGARHDFDVPIDWSHLAGFTRAVLRETARIRFGDTSTYAAVADGAGSPRAVRAAGNALGANPMPVVVPCHRVLRTGGALGGYTGGVERKEFLLRLEGAQL